MGAKNLTRRMTRREACVVRKEVAEGIDEDRVALEEDMCFLREVCGDNVEVVPTRSGRFLHGKPALVPFWC